MPAFDEAISIVQIIIAVSALYLAYRESRKWRTELIGSKRIELAIQLGKAALEVKHAFKKARNPASSDPDTKREFNYRLQQIADELNNLYKIRWETDILLDRSIQAEVEKYNGKYHELEGAMARIVAQRGSDQDDRFVFLGSDGDEFSQEINTITENLLNIARKFTK